MMKQTKVYVIDRAQSINKHYDKTFNIIIPSRLSLASAFHNV